MINNSIGRDDSNFLSVKNSMASYRGSRNHSNQRLNSVIRGTTSFAGDHSDSRLRSLVIPITEKNKKRAKEEVQKGREYQRIFNLWRYYDSLATMFATMGLLLGIISYEIDISHYTNYDIDPNHHGDLATLAMSTTRFTNPLQQLVRWTILVSSVCAVTCLLSRHCYRVKWTKTYFQKSSTDTMFVYYNEIIRSNLQSVRISETELKQA